MNPLVYVLAGAAVFFYLNRGPSSSAPLNTVTLYWADWCPHCHKLMPTWQMLGNAVGDYEIRQIEQKQNTEFSVSGYPTIVKKDGAGNTYTYKGPRTESAIRDWITSGR